MRRPRPFGVGRWRLRRGRATKVAWDGEDTDMPDSHASPTATLVADGDDLVFVLEPGFAETLGWEVGDPLVVTLLGPGRAVVTRAAPAGA